MQCPYCFLKMQLIVQNNKDVIKCSGCDGLWLNAESVDHMLDVNIKGCDNCSGNELEENVAIYLPSDKEYYFYKKLFNKNANPDDVFGFE